MQCKLYEQKMSVFLIRKFCYIHKLISVGSWVIMLLSLEWKKRVVKMGEWMMFVGVVLLNINKAFSISIKF